MLLQQGAQRHWLVRGTQACRSCIFEELPWATSHAFLLQFVTQEQSGLSHLIQAIVGKPLLVPQWRQPARRKTLLYLILYILFWSRCKGGKVPSAHRHALYRASEPCSWTAWWQAQKLNNGHTSSSAGRLKAVQTPHSLPSPSKEELLFQHLHHHSEHLQRKLICK